MIHFSETYGFKNDRGEFTAIASTFGREDDYGNKTWLRIEVLSDNPMWCRTEENGNALTFDVRYEPLRCPEDVDELVRGELVARYGARFK